MIAMFKVTYFDPILGSTNLEAYTVLAANAKEAIKKAEKKKSFKKYQPESVELLAIAD